MQAGLTSKTSHSGETYRSLVCVFIIGLWIIESSQSQIYGFSAVIPNTFLFPHLLQRKPFFLRVLHRIQSFCKAVCNLLLRVDVLQQLEKGFDAIVNGRKMSFFNLWIFGPVYLVAEMAVFEGDFHSAKDMEREEKNGTLQALRKAFFSKSAGKKCSGLSFPHRPIGRGLDTGDPKERDTEILGFARIMIIFDYLFFLELKKIILN